MAVDDWRRESAPQDKEPPASADGGRRFRSAVPTDRATVHPLKACRFRDTVHRPQADLAPHPRTRCRKASTRAESSTRRRKKLTTGESEFYQRHSKIEIRFRAFLLFGLQGTKLTARSQVFIVLGDTAQALTKISFLEMRIT